MAMSSVFAGILTKRLPAGPARAGPERRRSWLAYLRPAQGRPLTANRLLTSWLARGGTRHRPFGSDGGPVLRSDACVVTGATRHHRGNGVQVPYCGGVATVGLRRRLLMTPRPSNRDSRIGFLIRPGRLHPCGACRQREDWWRRARTPKTRWVALGIAGDGLARRGPGRGKVADQRERRLGRALGDSGAIWPAKGLTANSASGSAR